MRTYTLSFLKKNGINIWLQEHVEELTDELLNEDGQIEVVGKKYWTSDIVKRMDMGAYKAIVQTVLKDFTEIVPGFYVFTEDIRNFEEIRGQGKRPTLKKKKKKAS